MKRRKSKLSGKQVFAVTLALILTTSLLAGCKNKSTKENSAVAINETTGIENDSDYIRFFEGGKWGYLSSVNGNVCIPAKYSAASAFEHQQSFARVTLDDNKWGIIDIGGNTVVPCQFDKINPIPYIYTLTSAIKNGQTYIISLATGDECQIIEAGRYSDISELILGSFFRVKNNKNKVGLLLADGTILLKARYKNINVEKQDEYLYKIKTTDFKKNEELWIYECLERKIYKEKEM